MPHLARNHPRAPQEQLEFITIFIGGKPTAAQVYTATRATLRTPLHAGNHGYTHRARSGLGLLWDCGSPARRGPPVQHQHQCLGACLGVWFHPTHLGTGLNWETLGNGGD